MKKGTQNKFGMPRKNRDAPIVIGMQAQAQAFGYWIFLVGCWKFKKMVKIGGEKSK